MGGEREGNFWEKKGKFLERKGKYGPNKSNKICLWGDTMAMTHLLYSLSLPDAIPRHQHIAEAAHSLAGAALVRPTRRGQNIT